MTMPTPLVLVGTGEYYRNILIPALKRLSREGVAYPLMTIDVRERDDGNDGFFSSTPHYVRGEGEALSAILQPYAHRNPVVILGHANHLHVSDANDLVDHGIRVLIEKPYTIEREELSLLGSVIDGEFPRAGLIEYYLTMKAAPLYAFTGQLKRDSFFFADFLLGVQTDMDMRSCSLGDVKSVHVDVLEGEGSVGRLDHRGIHLIRRSHGGGMIHDLGVHALAPLMPLEALIGTILPSTMEVRTGHSREYLNMAETVFGLRGNEIGESYGEIRAKTSLDIPVTVRVGKYVCDNTNKRSLTIVGSTRTLSLDLTDPRVTVTDSRGHVTELFSLPKTPEKYYAVLRTSLLELDGKSPYTFSVSSASLAAQALVLTAVTLGSDRGIESLYDAGMNPEAIVV